jgi:hypothetical protein
VWVRYYGEQVVLLYVGDMGRSRSPPRRDHTAVLVPIANLQARSA